MKIRIKNEIKERINVWFEGNEIISVLMISTSSVGKNQVTIWSNKQQVVCVINSDCFTIIDESIPDEWSVSVDYKGDFVFGPAEWMQDNFWEKYHSEDSYAVDLFDKYKRYMG